MHCEPESEIVERIQSGETGLFSVLVRSYQSSLFSFLRSIVRNDADAEDLCQESFIRAYRAIGTYKAKSKFSTWLFSIAYNRAKTHLSKKSMTVSDDISRFVSSCNTASDAENNDLMRIIDEAINQLPEDKRSALHLFYREELSYREIAEVTGVPMNTIKSHIYRGKESLREYLSRAGIGLKED